LPHVEREKAALRERLFCFWAWQLLVRLRSVANVPSLFHAVRIMVSPVYEATKLIPLVHAAKSYPIAHANRHPASDVDIVRDEQSLPVPHIENNTLVPGAIVIIRQ
jgi:hypothetical protein